MTAPVLQRAWIIEPNQRIPILTYPTLLTQGGRYLRLIADTALANGFVCKGSSNGVTAAMDGVNRWTTDGAASVQGANTTSAQSWLVLTSSDGWNLCLAYVGATGDVMRISWSPSGAFAAAGTATHTPTAADELVIFTGVSLITNSLVNDRVLYVWIDSEAKMIRTCCFAAGLITNGTWGVELVNANRNTLTFTPAAWGFGFTTANMPMSSSQFFGAYSANAIGGQARINGTTVSIFTGMETFNAADFVAFAGPTKPALQRGIGPAMFPILIGTTTTNRQGPIGNLYDWWSGRNSSNQNAGDVVFPGGEWIQIGSGASSIVWPWDGTTISQVA